MNTGRWSKEEHNKYLKAMESFINWKTVSNLVGTRSISQCRSHNQKIHKRINSNTSYKIPFKLHKLSLKDDKLNTKKEIDKEIKEYIDNRFNEIESTVRRLLSLRNNK